MLRKMTRVDATQGSLIRLIFLYTIPLIFSAVIQKLFNAVDIIVLGNLADSGAVASVGATTTIIHLIVNTFFGISGGTRVILARQVGARDKEGVKQTVDTSMMLALAIGVFVAVVGTVGAPFFLSLTKCPSDCFDGAVLYIRMYLIAAPAFLLYNFGSAVLNATGDTQRPVYYIVASGILNVVLNVVLCLILPQKVAAVAIATAASQVLSAFLVCRRLCQMDGYGRVIISKMRWSAQAFLRILRQGIPLALNHALTPLANLQIQSAINSFDVSAVAGNSAAVMFGEIIGSITSSFGTTTTTFVGQNIGAKKPERVRRSLLYCLGIAVFLGTAMGSLIYLNGRHLLALVLPDDALAIEYAMIRMRYVVLFYGIQGANNVLGHAIQAYGYPTASAVNSTFFTLGFRVLWTAFVYPHYQTFSSLMLCFTVSWILMLAFNAVGCLVLTVRYHRGLLKKDL